MLEQGYAFLLNACIKSKRPSAHDGFFRETYANSFFSNLFICSARKRLWIFVLERQGIIFITDLMLIFNPREICKILKPKWWQRALPPLPPPLNKI